VRGQLTGIRMELESLRVLSDQVRRREKLKKAQALLSQQLHALSMQVGAGVGCGGG
jgi:hypothetical protein